jgi:glycosyltransferase involved in cell wall biosynthesis
VRALILHSGNLYGGIETALVSLAHGCRGGRAAIEPSFALCFDDGRVARELRDAGAIVHSLGAARVSRPWQVHQARARLRRLLASTPVDLCVTPSAWTHAIFAPVVRARSLPLVAWAHDRWSPARWLDRLALRHRPDLVIANSRYTVDGMKAALPDVAVRLVYYALATAPIDRSRRRETRAAFDTPDDAIVIVQVGRLDPYKGHQLLIEALGRLPDSIPWRCWIVGGADTQLQRDYLVQLKSTAARSRVTERVRFTGPRQDIGDVVAAADIFCHPNVAPEPFGIVFIEALRAGLPVIGSASGGVLDIVTGECGRLVPPGDVSALAAVLTEVLESSDLRLKLGASGPERAATLCDLDARLADLAQALATVVPSAYPRTGDWSTISASRI